MARIVRPAEAASGSGFFIDDGLLLTCAHVVKAGVGSTVSVQPLGRAKRDGTVLTVLPDSAQDLALVAVPSVAGEPPQPAVLLDAALGDNIDYFAVGFPRPPRADKHGLQELEYRGHRLRDTRSTTASWLIIDAGSALITPGLSGGAILNAETGAVAAIVQFASDPKANFGGGGIPVAVAAACLPEVARLIDRPPPASRGWRDALGQEGWQALNQSWEMPQCVDVIITGTDSRWKVAVEPGDGTEVELTSGDLPSEVARALFYWAQMRLPTRQSEVELVGKLLSSAVFPPSMSSHFDRRRPGEELLVRLRVESDDGLFNVPWEFVTAPGATDRKPLVAGKTTNLVRVGRHRTPDRVSVAPALGAAELLGIVVDPPDLAIGGGDWAADAASKLEGAAACASLQVRMLERPTLSQLEEAISETPRRPPIEVVHYIGFGRTAPDGRELALLDVEGNAAFKPAPELFGLFVKSGARLLVVQLLAPPLAKADWEPFDPRAFLGALDGRVNAVVFNRLPIAPRRASVFNRLFYSMLRRGQTVEAAVGEARRQLHSDAPDKDLVSFAWYTLLTGPKAHMQLLRPEGDANRGGVQAPPPPALGA